MGQRLTLSESAKGNFPLLEAGRYLVEYTDSTHLQRDQWVRLGLVELQGAAKLPTREGVEQYFSFITDIEDVKENARKKQEGQATAEKGSTDKIRDALALAFGRLGLLTPEISTDLLDVLLHLQAQDGVVLVPDTNALYNGAVHWLLRALRGPSIWLLPVVASLTTVQNRDAMVKNQINKHSLGNMHPVLRSRALVNGALGLMQRNRGRCQVVEIDPSLLRYQKTASDKATDPDQSDVLEDRLIIEAIHGVLRSMRSRTARRVVTSDVNIARVLEAEGVETLFVPTILLPEGKVECIRFDPFAREFLGTPLRGFLWELTHTFGSVRLRLEQKVVGKFECYWKAKSPSEWTREVLMCDFEQVDLQTPPQGSGSPTPPAPSANAAQVVADQSPAVQIVLPEALPDESANGEDAAIAPSHADPAPSRSKAPRRQSSPRRPSEITTSLPRASFPLVLNLLASASRQGKSDAQSIIDGTGESKLTLDNARRGIEILRRADFLVQDGDEFSVSADVQVLEKALALDDLDTVSRLFERFLPYGRFLSELQTRSAIPRSEVVSVVKDLVGQAGTFESERLPRFHILLGQAWTDGDLILDGSQRPTDRDAAEAFDEAFEASMSNGIATFADFLPQYCKSTRMSPWMAKKEIERFVADDLLPKYRFQSAAGGKPQSRDQVIGGTLQDFRLEPVVIDRIQSGQSPVFTIERSAR